MVSVASRTFIFLLYCQAIKLLLVFIANGVRALNRNIFEKKLTQYLHSKNLCRMFAT